MLEKEMNAYRFSKGQESIDKMMEQIMKEMVQEPRESSKKAIDAHLGQMCYNLLLREICGQNA